MAGIYIHIPFCKSRCIYCDFHSGTDFLKKEKLIEALCLELECRKNYLENGTIRTIYFGGGTPSLLNRQDFEKILDTISSNFDTSSCVEMTLEVNPDDITTEYVQMLRSLGFNRISIGVQSFQNDELKLINRRHSAQKAIEAVQICQANGFENISIDLMYGLPNQSLDNWKKNLEKAIELNVQHISAYHLTYEEGTKIYQLLQEGKINPVTEETSGEMFKLLIETLENNGFEQYEISNFSKPGYRSQHNSSYWNSEKYLGIGPSAHSYNLHSREWNSSNTSQYIRAIELGQPVIEKEELTPEEKYNDFIITRLRTKEGINLDRLKEFGDELYQYCLANSQSWLDRKLMMIKNNHLSLTREGIFISDTIFSDLIRI